MQGIKIHTLKLPKYDEWNWIIHLKVQMTHAFPIMCSFVPVWSFPKEFKGHWALPRETAGNLLLIRCVWGGAARNPWRPFELPVRTRSNPSVFTRIHRNVYNMKGLQGIPQVAHFKWEQFCFRGPSMWPLLRGQVNKALWQPARNKNGIF